MAEPKITRRKLAEFRPAEVNPNAGNENSVPMIEDSISQNGAGRPMLAASTGEMIAGSHSLQAFADRGFEEVLEVSHDGSLPIVFRRTDLTPDDPKAIALKIGDNEITKRGYTPDKRVIAALLGDIKEKDPAALKGTGLRAQQIGAVLESLKEDENAVEFSRYDVPDAIFPTDNDFDIPVLLTELQADALDAPVSTWRESHWSGKSGGTILFYLDDSRFNALWNDPTALIKTQPITIVEPNFSMNIVTPRALCLWTIYRKRWLARYWQGFGIRVFVDLNVSGAAPNQYEDNLLGVPKGWKAYATRAHNEQHEAVEREFEIACEHSGIARPLFVVYGGGKAMQARCKERQWIWIPEPSEFARSLNFGRQQK